MAINNTLIILENELKKLINVLTDIDCIEKTNPEMSNLKFETRKEDARKSMRIRIELKKAYLDGYKKALDDASRGN